MTGTPDSRAQSESTPQSGWSKLFNFLCQKPQTSFAEVEAFVAAAQKEGLTFERSYIAFEADPYRTPQTPLEDFLSIHEALGNLKIDKENETVNWIDAQTPTSNIT